MTKGTLARIEAHLWVCQVCGSEPTVRGTIDEPLLVCPMHPEAGVRNRSSRR